MKDNNYIVVQSWMCSELRLKSNELLVFALIHGFSQDGESRFCGSRSYIAKTLNITLPTVDSAIKSLVDKKLIEQHKVDRNGMIFNSYNSLYPVKKLYTPGKETLHNNINNNKLFISKDINNNKKYSRKSESEIQTFVNMYHSYCPSLPKCLKITNSRKTAIKKIIDKYGHDNIVDVFLRCENNEFLKGNNDRGWKANIDFIIREDKFVKILEGGYDMFNSKGNAQQNIERLNIRHVPSMTEEDYKEQDKFVRELEENGLQAKF